MKESNKQNSTLDIFETRPSPMPEEVPFDLSSSANTIPPAQNPKKQLSLGLHKKKPSDYARDRAEKYANYFKEGEILLIPELVEAVEPKTLSFVVTDLNTKRLAGLKKRNFRGPPKKCKHPR